MENLSAAMIEAAKDITIAVIAHDKNFLLVRGELDDPESAAAEKVGRVSRLFASVADQISTTS